MNLTWREVGIRLVRLVATILIVTFGTTVLVGLVPGDPARYIAGDNATPEVLEAINERTGFNDPLLVRYGRWVGNILQGDMGTSHLSNQPVWQSIKERLPVTFELALLATLLSLAVAVPLAVLAASRGGSRTDRALGGVTSAMVSVPSFVAGALLLYFFAFQWRIFPVIGWTPLTENPWENLRSAALPVLAISLAEMVVIYRVLRSDLLTTLQQEYIAVARSKGLSNRAVMWRHALRPSSASIVTLSALQLARFLGGTVVVESLFVLPGLGTLLITAINSKDIVLLQGVVAFLAVVFLLVSFCLDLLYGVIDPRTRVAQ
ncbi:MAG: ABC transporter permease [Microthrixaceae bacterium]